MTVTQHSTLNKDQAPNSWRLLSTPCIWIGNPGPRLMIDTQHSTLKTQCILMGESWVWSVNPECRVLSMHHEFGGLAPNVRRLLSNPHLKLQTQLQIFEWGNFECGKSHIPCSGLPIQIDGVLSVECWVSVISLGPDHGMWIDSTFKYMELSLEF